MLRLKMRLKFRLWFLVKSFAPLQNAVQRCNEVKSSPRMQIFPPEKRTYVGVVATLYKTLIFFPLSFSLCISVHSSATFSIFFRSRYRSELFFSFLLSFSASFLFLDDFTQCNPVSVARSCSARSRDRLNRLSANFRASQSTFCFMRAAVARMYLSS